MLEVCVHFDEERPRKLGCDPSQTKFLIRNHGRLARTREGIDGDETRRS